MQVNQNNQTNYHNTYVTPPMSDMSPTQWEGEVQQAQPGHTASFWSTGQPEPMGLPQPMNASQSMGAPQTMGSPQTMNSSQTSSSSRSISTPQTMGQGSPSCTEQTQSGSGGQPSSQSSSEQTAAQQFMEQFGRGGEARFARWRDALSLKPLDMSNGLTQEAIENPMSREEVLIGGLKGLLSKNLGHYVIATFIVGVQNFVVWRGVLESVGNDYLVIYQPNQDSHVSCDFYSLKFIEFPNSYDTIWNYAPGQEQK